MKSEKETQALEAFLRFTVRKLAGDRRVWHRDHRAKNFRIAIELCEELDICGVDDLKKLEVESKKLAKETTCNKSHANVLSRVAFSIFGCHLCKKLPFSICVERKAGAFSPTNGPYDAGADEAKSEADRVKKRSDRHLATPN
jgi:hypothetical protein